MKRLMLLAALALSGCASTTPVIVHEPVAVTCVPQSLPDAPKVEAPADLAKIEGPDRYLKIASAYLTLYARSLESEPTLSACRGVEPPH